MSSPKKSAIRAAEEQDPYLYLYAKVPCVGENPDGTRNFWIVKRTDDYNWDNYVGHGVAIQLLKEMRRDPDLLRAVVRDMVIAGTFAGVEVGFFSELCDHFNRQCTCR